MTAAWTATEPFLPKLFDDSLGHNLFPERTLRQGADPGGYYWSDAVRPPAHSVH